MTDTQEPEVVQVRPSVFIAVPSVSGWVHSRTMQSIISQMDDHKLHFILGAKPVGEARNRAVEAFLKTNCTHLWFVDDDTVPPVDALARLLALDADIATAVTPILKEGGTVSNIFPTNDASKQMDMVEIEKLESPFNIAGVGGSCMLIKRRVFDDPNSQHVVRPWYSSHWLQDGRFVEEDIEFCNKATDEGYLIQCDPKIVCRHAKEVLI